MSRDLESLIERSLVTRYRRERWFRGCGRAAIIIGGLFLLWLFGTTLHKAAGAVWQTHIALDVALPADLFASQDRAGIEDARLGRPIKNALYGLFPEVKKRKEKKQLNKLLSTGAEYQIRETLRAEPARIGRTSRFWVLADDEVDMLIKGKIDRDLPANERRLSDLAIGWIDRLSAAGRVQKFANWRFLTAGDSRDAEQAGIGGAIAGSVFVLLTTMLLALPIGVAAAIYLQEFAPQNRLTDWVEVNINNLAAVPSIIFGLLGLAILINFFGLPRSVPLVGGMVLALMTLPTIIISSRAALAAVSPMIRQAALGIGASRMQSVLHHVLPLAMPGILTGAIIGLARALGETAPLLVIGMVAFIVDIPQAVDDPATALPVQIFLWADSPERAFVERTSAAIIVLLSILIFINGVIAVLRGKMEKRR